MSGLCTNVHFDFEKRKWTDGKLFFDNNFFKKWENKFDSVWNELENVLPKQPFQPEYISLGKNLTSQNLALQSLKFRQISKNYLKIDLYRTKHIFNSLGVYFLVQSGTRIL